MSSSHRVPRGVGSSGAKQGPDHYPGAAVALLDNVVVEGFLLADRADQEAALHGSARPSRSGGSDDLVVGGTADATIEDEDFVNEFSLLRASRVIAR